MIRAVTFDAAGTLIALAEAVGTTYTRVARAYGVALDAATTEARFRTAFAAAPPLAFGRVSSADRGARERAWWRVVVQDVFGSAADHPAFAASFDALFAHYADPSAWRTFPDVPETLRRLRARGVRLGVVSNFDGRLPGLLAGLGLAPCFDATIVSTAVGVAKPASGIFAAATAALGAHPSETAHVGDDLHADIEGARGAGCRAIYLDRAGRHPPLPADIPTVSSLTELELLL